MTRKDYQLIADALRRELRAYMSIVDDMAGVAEAAQNLRDSYPPDTDYSGKWAELAAALDKYEEANE